MQQSVLIPLGMAHSAFETGVLNSPLMAKGYRGREAVPETPLRDMPAGGQIALPRQALPPGMGFFAHIVDLDGNRVGLHALS